MSICEDIWYPAGPAPIQAQAGAELLVNINASPYHRGKRELRERMLATRAADNEVVVCYLNTVGGQDELVFDGGSLIFDQAGRLLAEGRQFEEELVVADLDIESVFRSRLHDPRRRKEPIFPVLAEVATPEITLSEEPDGSALPAQPVAAQRRIRSSWRVRPRSTPPWCWAPATTSTRTASSRCSSASPAGSTPPSSPPSPWTRWGRRT